MNKPIRLISIFCFVLFGALLINATWVQYFQSDNLNSDPRNRRVTEAAFSRERGAILAGREPIARSVPSEGRYDFQRTYPLPFKYAPITGAFTLFSQTGLERSQNLVLSGEDDRLFVNRMIDMISNADPQGGNVQTTIDPRAQDAAWEGLQALGKNVRGAVVAIEPSTGRILANVSNPTYDPNLLAAHDAGAVVELSRELQNDPADPLINRGIGTTLPPGSTFKLVTAAAAIEEYGLTADSMVDAGSSFRLPESSTSVGNEGGGNCGGDKITLSRALEVSCNVTFMKLADKLGTKKMLTMAEKFGFNHTQLLDLPGQARSLYPADMDAPQTALSGIGQSNVTATPLQMAMVTAAIANDGVLMRPYVVDQVLAADLDVLDKTEPQALPRVMKPSTARELNKMMVQTVATGTATNAQIPGELVGGKTGTAQSSKDRPPYAWFVSFAPAGAPQVAVAVMVESSDTSRPEIAGGRLGAPIAKKVMEAVLRR